MNARAAVAATLVAGAMLSAATVLATPSGESRGVQESTDAARVAYHSGRYDEALNAFRQRVRVAQAPVSDHRGLGSMGYDQGRYVADDEDNWYSESGLHRFHRLVLAALDH